MDHAAILVQMLQPTRKLKDPPLDMGLVERLAALLPRHHYVAQLHAFQHLHGDVKFGVAAE